jgi:hypothetical protein
VSEMPTRLFDTAPDREPTQAELEGLEEIRRRRRTIWLLLLSVPVLALLGSAVSGRATTLLVGLGILGFAAAIVRHNLSACPRCGDRFNHLNPWTQACVFCGLALATPRNAGHPKNGTSSS